MTPVNDDCGLLTWQTHAAAHNATTMILDLDRLGANCNKKTPKKLVPRYQNNA